MCCGRKPAARRTGKRSGYKKKKAAAQNVIKNQLPITTLPPTPPYGVRLTETKEG